MKSNSTGRKQRGLSPRRAAFGCAWLIAKVTCFAAPIAGFPTGDNGWLLGTFGVGKISSAPGRQIVMPYINSNGQWVLDAFTYTGQRVPGFPYVGGLEAINASPTLYDLDGDGLEEILFTCGNRVIALRGNGSVIWSSTVDSNSYVPNGGYQTVTGGFYWYPGGAWMSRLPANAVFSSQVSPPVVMDLNGTGNCEVLTAWKIKPDPAGEGQDYNPFLYPVWGAGQWGLMGENWSGGVVSFDARNGQQSFVYHTHQLIEAGLAAGRASASGPLKVYALTDSDSVVCFDKSQPHGLWGKGMLHKQFGKNQRLMTGSYQIPIDVHTADIDGDGLDECLVAGTQFGTFWQPNETILDDDGAILWRRWLPSISYANNYGWLNSASLIPCNPDHDNHIDVLGWNHSGELTFRYWNGTELADRAGWPKNFAPFLPTPPVVGDVDGDGQEELVIGTYNPSATPSSGGLLVYALDGTLKQNIPVAGGIKHIPALADVEGVGRTDVIFRSVTGQVYVYNFGATTTNGISWATHRGNMHRDGNCGVSLYPPGTPRVTRKTSGCNRASFAWTNAASGVQSYRIYRAEQAAGPFELLASLAAGTTSYTDDGLKPGCQYYYEVHARYSGGGEVASAPFAVLSLLNGNLVANAGFEENDNSHWDKWFTGNIGMTNMCVSTNVAFQGKRSMQILLENQSGGGSIAQFDQYGIPDSTIYVTPDAWYSFGGWFRSTGISQPSEHWLEWASTKTGYDTSDRPPLPWPYYYTPHLVIGTTNTDWNYENRTFQLPPGFPNIEIWHRYSVNAPASGSIYLDNIFFRQIPAPTATNWTSLVPFGATWRYSTTTPPASWCACDFNDSAWPSGKAKLGNGTGPSAIATRLTQYQPDYYFRAQFTLGSTNLEELLLCAICTDYYPLRLWLNGVEIPSTLEVTTLAGNETRYFDLTPFVSWLRPGANTLAALLPNTWGSDYDDIAFDLSLKAIDHSSPLAVVPKLQCPRGGLPCISVETPLNSVWQVQSTDALSPPHWQVVTTFTNLTGTTQSATDTGQNGRLPPSQAPARYYRLVPLYADP